MLLFFSISLFANGDFWSQLKGPGGGDIVSITFNDSGQCYIASDGNGIYYSDDNGQNWQQVNNS
jgi:photosystem II stability/assembly factor-like uncharacterized protein